MKKIALANGKGYALVDDEDYDRVMKHGWSATLDGYAVSRMKQRNYYMHRWLIDAPKGMDVDHINMNKLDNRKDNLRICTRSQNKANVGIRSNNTSGYKGVTFVRSRNKYLAQIRVFCKNRYLGYFTDPIEAARAYDEAALKYFGEFARLNFPREK